VDGKRFVTAVQCARMLESSRQDL